MPWKKSTGVAQYGDANWTNFIKREPNCTDEMARRIALQDPEITFYFICNEYMVLGGNAAAYSPFNPGDVIFFKGEPWFGEAPQCDSYVKEGMNVAYVVNPTTEQFEETAKYNMADGGSSIDVCVIFGANSYLQENIPANYVSLAPNTAVPSDDLVLVGNPQCRTVLPKVKELQDKGLNVLLSVLTLEWQQFPNTKSGKAKAEIFVAQLKECVENYGLDGIDIDDEGSPSGSINHTSITMMTSLLKKAMPGKIISKALWSDSRFFTDGTWEGHTLAENLTYGWQMTYGEAPEYVLPPYVGYGMAKKVLSLGFWQGQPSAHPDENVKWLKDNGYGGVMVFGFGADGNTELMGKLVNDWYGPGNWNKS